jgi:hypothetical protein
MLEGSFVVATNGYDDRALALRVVHDDGAGRPLDVGVVELRMADLVAKGELSLSAGSVAELLVEADPADRPDGAYAGLQPIPDGASNLAPAWSSPTPVSRAFRIVSVDASAVVGDCSVKRAEGRAPHLFVEIEQRGAVVYRTPVAPDRSVARWTPAAAYLFVEPEETLTVRLGSADPDGSHAVLVQQVPGRALDAGAVALATPRGSTVRLALEPRRAGPGPRLTAR